MLKIKKEFKDLIPPLTAEEFNQLEQNILREGIRDAIIVWNGFVVDGHNRFEIATKHGLTFRTEEKQFAGIEEVKDWMDANQLGRRNLTDDQRRIIIGRRYIREQKQGKRNDLTSGQVDHKSTAKKLAAENNISEKTVRRFSQEATMFDELQKAEPEVAAEVWSGKKKMKDVKKEKKKKERKQQIEKVKQKIEQENLVAPEKKYHVIAIDPPWAYNEKGGFSSDQYDAESNRGAVDYPTMTIQQIKKIDLPAAEDCVLFLWTTHAFLRDSFEILERWGFEYKATIVWDKIKMGIGRTIRMQVEFCLLGIKGKPIINGSSERDIITEARREHSRKPEAFYEMVERMTVGNKLDFFSRQTRNNWDHYGAEQNKF